MKNLRNYLVFFFVFVSTTAISQDRWYVNSSLTGIQSGMSWADAFHDLQQAIDASNAGDSIFVAVGTYYPNTVFGTSTDSRDQAFLVKNGIHIYGGFVGNESELEDRPTDSVSIHGTNASILSGDLGTVGDSSDNAFHVILLLNNSTTTVFDGLTVSSGNANEVSTHTINTVVVDRNFGGGITAFNSDLLINNCLIRDNLALSGGAGMNNENGSNVIISDSWISGNKIWGSNSNDFGGGGLRNENSSPHITNVNFMMNYINDIQGGGGMRNESSSHPVIEDCYFYKNIAHGGDGGAGMYNASGSNPVITDVHFYKNHTSDQGAGIYNDNSKPELEDVLFEENIGINGGGAMENDGGSDAVLNRVIFILNHSNVNGGAIQNWQSSPVFNEVRFISNSAGGDGGALYNYNNCSPEVSNSYFTNNSAVGNGGAIFNLRNSNPILTNILVADNQSGAYGGGIYSASHSSSPCSPIVTNATFTNNHADSSGGGGFDDGAGNTKVRNCIISGNTSPGEADIDAPPTMAVTALFRVIIGTDYYVTGLTPPSTVSSTIFINPSNSDYELINGSPAINKGDSTYFNTSQTPDLSFILSDIRGANRTMGSNIDLGSYEVCSDTTELELDIIASPGPNVPNGTTITFSATYKANGNNPIIVWLMNNTETGDSGLVYTAVAGVDLNTNDSVTARMHIEHPCNKESIVYSTPIWIWVTGLDELNTSNDFLIYPNPVSSILSIDFKENAQPSSLELIDVSGRSLISRKLNSKKIIQLDVKPYTEGLYFLKFYQDGGLLGTQRFVINK